MHLVQSVVYSSLGPASSISDDICTRWVHARHWGKTFDRIRGRGIVHEATGAVGILQEYLEGRLTGCASSSLSLLLLSLRVKAETIQ